MGGWGSGRRRHIEGRATTADFMSFDVRHWHREGYLSPGQRLEWQWSQGGGTHAHIWARVAEGQVVFTCLYQSGEEGWKSEEWIVRLVWASCTLGGYRPWFQCPTRGCGRRVAILYTGGPIVCRRCLGLVYASQRATRVSRALRRIELLRQRLGWEPHLLSPLGGKPKGMHMQTFLRLEEELIHALRVSLGHQEQGLARFEHFVSGYDGHH